MVEWRMKITRTVDCRLAAEFATARDEGSNQQSAVVNPLNRSHQSTVDNDEPSTLLAIAGRRRREERVRDRARRTLRRRDRQLRIPRRSNRGFDIGPTSAALEQRGVPHHMVNVVDPTRSTRRRATRARRRTVIRDLSREREAADPRRRHGVLLPRPHARAVGDRDATSPCAGASRA